MKKYLIILSIGLGISFIIIVLSWFNEFERLDLKTLDWRLKLRGEKKPSGDITLIYVDSIYRRSLSRENYAFLVNKYREAKAIGFDLVLNKNNNEEDVLLETASMVAKVYYAFGKSYGNEEFHTETEKRVMAFDRFKWEIDESYKGKLDSLGKFEIVTPLPKFSNVANGVGHIYAGTAPEKILRKIPLIIEYNGNVYPLLSLQIACDFKEVIERKVRLGKYIELTCKNGERIRIPINDKGYMYINYTGNFNRGKGEPYNGYSLSEVVRNQPNLPAGIILIGPEVKDEVDTKKGIDIHDTPFGEYPGVAIHAAIIDNIINQKFLYRTGKIANNTMFVLLGLIIGGIIYTSWKVRTGNNSFLLNFCCIKGLFLTAVFAVLFLLITFILFKRYDIYIHIALPLTIMLSMIMLYLLVGIYQIDLKICYWIKNLRGKRVQVICYCISGILFFVSVAIVYYSKGNIYTSLYAIILLILAFRFAGLISAKKFEDIVGNLPYKKSRTR